MGRRNFAARRRESMRKLARRMGLPPGVDHPEDLVVRLLSPAQRVAIAEHCASLLVRAASNLPREHEEWVVALLNYLFPTSEPHLRRVLAAKGPRGIERAHFSICCTLDAMHEDARSRPARQKAALLHEFLFRSRTDAGTAAFQAGCSLGWFFPPTLAAPLLVDVVRNSPHVEARAQAIHGFEHLLKRVPRSGKTSTLLRRVLRIASKHDPSPRVRRCASSCLAEAPRAGPPHPRA